MFLVSWTALILILMSSYRTPGTPEDVSCFIWIFMSKLVISQYIFYFALFLWIFFFLIEGMPCNTLHPSDASQALLLSRGCLLSQSVSAIFTEDARWFMRWKTQESFFPGTANCLKYSLCRGSVFMCLLSFFCASGSVKRSCPVNHASFHKSGVWRGSWTSSFIAL